MESILASVKKFIGFSADYTPFDDDILFQINSCIATLTQVGPDLSGDFVVAGYNETWDDFYELIDTENNGFNRTTFEMVKNYIFIKSRIVFDPPTSSFVLDALKQKAEELEWRISIMHTPTN